MSAKYFELEVLLALYDRISTTVRKIVSKKLSSVWFKFQNLALGKYRATTNDSPFSPIATPQPTCVVSFHNTCLR